MTVRTRGAPSRRIGAGVHHPEEQGGAPPEGGPGKSNDKEEA